MSNQSEQITPRQVDEEKLALESSLSSGQSNPMSEYYQLQRTLYGYILILIGIIFPSVWYFHTLEVALNYLLGAIVSVFYLRFLAKDVESLGQQQQRLGGKGIGIFVILILIASKWQRLSILPVFLGFLTYKGAIILYTLQTVFVSLWQENRVNSNISDSSGIHK